MAILDKENNEKEYLKEPLKPIEPPIRIEVISEKTKTSNLEDDIDILGGGNYAIGNSTRDSTTGTQAITGIGFTPKLVRVIAVYAADPGGHSVGHATSTTDEFCIIKNVGGTTTYSSTLIISIDGTTHNDASLNSLDSDGFTLNWGASSDLINFGYECFG